MEMGLSREATIFGGTDENGIPHETKPENRKQSALCSFLPVPVCTTNLSFSVFCVVVEKRKRVLGKEEKGKFRPLWEKGVFAPCGKRELSPLR